MSTAYNLPYVFQSRKPNLIIEVNGQKIVFKKTNDIKPKWVFVTMDDNLGFEIMKANNSDVIMCQGGSYKRSGYDESDDIPLFELNALL